VAEEPPRGIRLKRRKKITFKAEVQYVPYASEEAREDAYRAYYAASIKAFENKIKYERKGKSDHDWLGSHHSTKRALRKTEN
jgi:hypothetical protein